MLLLVLLLMLLLLMLNDAHEFINDAAVLVKLFVQRCNMVKLCFI